MMNLGKLRSAVKRGNIFWNKHSFARMLERGISRRDVITAVMNGEVIKEYADDKPLPSMLILGWAGKDPLHVVAGIG